MIGVSKIKLDTPILFAVGYLITLSLGLVTSFFLSLHDLKNLFYDADFISAQFHYFIAIIILFAVFGAFYSCSKKIIKVYYSEILGQIHFWTFFIGVHLTFFPTFFIGIGNLKRKNLNVSWEIIDIFNYTSLIGFYFLLISFFIFLVVLVEAVIRNRIKKYSISNLTLLNMEGHRTKLDFVVSAFFYFYFIVYFLISIVNKTYWVLLIYCTMK